MFGKKRSAESLSDEEKQKLIGMLWSLKASNFSTVLGALQVEGEEAQIITTNSSATAVFYRNAMAFGLAKEKPLEGVDWPEDVEKPDAIVFQALDEARPVLLEMCYLSVRTGAPPAAGVITKDCITILERYAEDNNAESQRKLGLLYDKGVCVAENTELAAKLYMAAAEQGDAPASNNLAMMYVTGRGVKQDFAQALKYFQKAADLGNVMAMDNLGETYNRGIGVAADVHEAFKWFYKAAENGHVDAACKVGVAYYRGVPVARDLRESYIWFGVAASLGADVQSTLNEIASALTEDQMKQAGIALQEKLAHFSTM